MSVLGMSLGRRQDFRNLILDQNLIVDVRAPIEFEQGHLPGSVNLPILENDEREKIGTVYKQQGRDEAVSLGHQIVQGEVKERRLNLWTEMLKKTPDSLLTCFRGGMRSQLAQAWCAESGTSRDRIEGGYKAFRQFLIEQLQGQSEKLNLIVVSGATGCGKTRLLGRLANQKTLDLEKMAIHRGSVFGAQSAAQPSQASFENHLAWELVRKSTQRQLIVEDESRMIGSCAQPENFFQKLRSSPVVMIDENLESRTSQIYSDYILNSSLSESNLEAALHVFDRYEKALHILQRKLGGLRFAEVLRDLQLARASYLEKQELEPNRIWIQKLLEWYYDPIYQRSLERRSPQIIFRGTHRDVLSFLIEQSP